MKPRIFWRLVIVLFLTSFSVIVGLSQTETKDTPQTKSIVPRNYRARINDTFVYNALRQIHSAQTTYNATVGNRNFAFTLQKLANLDFIDQVLGSGAKYGYYFTMSATDGSPSSPAFFMVTAAPSRYPKTYLRSFYLDSTGEIHGADKNGAVATVNDPIILICGDNEMAAIQSVRTIHSAETTYQATVGNGNFGTFQELYLKGLIDSSTARGDRCGYYLTLFYMNGTQSNLPKFYITTVPQQYPVSGRRSFYIDEQGVVRGADHNGQPATADDPPIEF